MEGQNSATTLCNLPGRLVATGRWLPYTVTSLDSSLYTCACTCSVQEISSVHVCNNTVLCFTLFTLARETSNEFKYLAASTYTSFHLFTLVSVNRVKHDRPTNLVTQDITDFTVIAQC